MKYFIIFVSIFISQSIQSNLKNKTFVPTEEWQTIDEDQPIPAGLHVRINLTSGKKEAKLLSDNNSSSGTQKSDITTLHSDEEMSQEDYSKPKISKSLGEALKKIQSKRLSIDYSPESFEEQQERVRQSYRDYKQLKRDFEDMKMNVKSDAQVITDLLEDYNNTSHGSRGQKEILTILEDLNYLAHEIDNALWIINSGGLDFVVLPMIVNQSNIEYRIASLRLLGALTQNNPKAQIKVYEKNFGSYISNILIGSKDSSEISTGLYAFGSLLRRFPYAQLEILPKLGTKALISVLSKNIDLKNRAKSLTLIADLLEDRENALNYSDFSDPEMSYNLKEQYIQIYLDVWLEENQFCNVVSDFIWSSRNELLTTPDITENIIDAMLICSNICSTKWSSSKLLKTALNSIENDFLISNTEYLVEIGQKIILLKAKIFPKKLQKKDEF